MKAMLKGLFLCLTMHTFDNIVTLIWFGKSSSSSTICKLKSIGLRPNATAAAKKGIEMKVVSAYRSYNRQENLEYGIKHLRRKGLNPKCHKKIITYSTLPGTSRHHWGTDIDIIDNAIPKLAMYF